MNPATPDYCVDCGNSTATNFDEDPLCSHCHFNRQIALLEQTEESRVESGLTRWSETGTSRRTR